MGSCRSSSTITITNTIQACFNVSAMDSFFHVLAVNPGATPSSPARYRKSIAYRGHWREQKENINRWLLSGKIWSPDVKQKTQKIIWSERGSLLNHRTLDKNSFSLRERMKAEQGYRSLRRQAVPFSLRRPNPQGRRGRVGMRGTWAQPGTPIRSNLAHLRQMAQP